ncbi:MAG: hypothetical protein E2P02_14000 [Acidobacteria bacterium]|nr:MAG: hypothetical protein E2P02_14000 [Acidobacteriota bacterium]
MKDSERRISARRSAKQAASFLSRHPVTLFVIGISALCIFAIPPITRQFTTLPPFRLIFENANRDSLLGAGLWVYVALLGILYFGVLFVVSSDSDVQRESRPSLFRRMGRSIRQSVRPRLEKLLYYPAKRRPRRQRRVLGLVFVLVGTGLYALLYYISDFLPAAGPPVQTYWAIFLIFVGAWLVIGEFDASTTDASGDGPDEIDESDSNKRHWANCTNTAGLILLLFLMNGIVGAIVWGLAESRLEALPVSWRVYTLWALVQVGLVALGLGLFADAFGRTAGQRLAVFAGVLLLLAVPKSTVPIGYEAEGKTASLTRSRDQERKGLKKDWDELDQDEKDTVTRKLQENWFKAVRARLDSMPKTEPVIFVAAAGGGSRAALYATLVLEMLERTPPHGSLDDWTRVETPERSLADQVLFISSVSGGSLASAHFALSDRTRPPVAKSLRNTLLTQLNDTFCDELGRICELQWERCSQEEDIGIENGRECAVKHRLCTKSAEGFHVIDFNPGARGESENICKTGREDGKLGWPVGSTRFDDMATDFNAPMLRGVVMPGVERGEMVTQFWRKLFRWRETYERSEKEHGRRPLLLINVTDVLDGSRVVAGFPRLPQGLLGTLASGGHAEAITDIDPRMAVDVEEAVRMSANFPWGFDLPMVGLGPSGSRENRVIDGGVLDNSGIDTFTVLLDRLDYLSSNVEETCDPDGNDLGCSAGWLLDELARRGVVLLEIDSGAKPEPPGRISKILANVLLPVYALSISSYARSVEASQFHSGKLQRVLRRHMNHLLDREWESRTRDDADGFNDDINLVGKRLAHVVYVLDTEHLMTAWALSPEEKAELLARFLAEDSRQRLELRDQFEDIEGANVARAVLIGKAVNDAKLRTFLLNLSDSMNELIRREREAIARDTERRRRYYERLPEEAAKVADPTGGEGRRGWIFVGYYHDDSPVELADTGELKCDTALEPYRWLLDYVDFDVGRVPQTLRDHTFKTSSSLKLHRSAPNENGEFDKRPFAGVLPRGTTLRIENIAPWQESGFYFAQVTVLEEPSDE